MRMEASTAGWISGRSVSSLTIRREIRRLVSLAGTALLLLTISIGVRLDLAQRHDMRTTIREELRLLPHGEVLRPLLLGYHHAAADLLWLKAVQVLGEREVRQADYAWLAHVLDVVTTLDPHYVYAYDMGGVVLAELAGQVEWSNRLLTKGMAANPDAWRLPFQAGFNAFFHERDYLRAANYMAQAARLPGRPAYVPELAARLYVEGHQPTVALAFLETIADETHDGPLRAALERRKAEVIVERDLDHLTAAVQLYREQAGRWPQSLEQLLETRVLADLPVEPFGGVYRWDAESERVVSTTHPTRLRLHRAPDATLSMLNE